MPISIGHEHFHNISIGAKFCGVGLKELDRLNESDLTHDDVHSICVGAFNVSQGLELIFRSILMASGVSTKAKGNHPISSFFQSVCKEFPSFASQLNEIGLCPDICSLMIDNLQMAHSDGRYFGLGQNGLKVANIHNAKKFYLLLGITFLENTSGFKQFKQENLPN